MALVRRVRAPAGLFVVMVLLAAMAGHPGRASAAGAGLYEPFPQPLGNSPGHRFYDRLALSLSRRQLEQGEFVTRPDGSAHSALASAAADAQRGASDRADGTLGLSAVGWVTGIALIAVTLIVAIVGAGGRSDASLGALRGLARRVR